MMQTLSHPLTTRTVGFIDHLRMNGFAVGPSESEACLSHIIGKTTGDRGLDHDRMKALLTGCKEEWDSFDDLFESYWIGAGKFRERMKKTTPSTRTSKNLPQAWKNHFGDDEAAEKAPQIESEGGAEVGETASGRLIAVDQNTRMKIDLRQFVEPDEIAAAEALAYRLASAIRYRLSRRYYNSRKTTRLDMRRTIRRNMKHGGTPIDLSFKAKPEQPVRIIVFLDVSGSMQHYSRFFLQFVKGLVCQWAQTDAYLFHTKLVRVTDAMSDKNSFRAMTRLSLMAEGFGGGTKLGNCLETFNRQYAKKTLNGRSIVMIFSDGYEVGEPDRLCEQLVKIKKRARRLVWLNPLLGWQNYQPITAAMNAAKPLVDHFAVANTLQSLAAIETDLMKL